MQLLRKREYLPPFPKAQTFSPVKSHAVATSLMKVGPTSLARLLQAVTSAWWCWLTVSLSMQLFPYIKSIRWGRIESVPMGRVCELLPGHPQGDAPTIHAKHVKMVSSYSRGDPCGRPGRLLRILVSLGDRMETRTNKTDQGVEIEVMASGENGMSAPTIPKVHFSETAPVVNTSAAT